MKTQKKNTTKTLTSTMLVVMILTIAACSNKQENSSGEDTKASALQQTPIAPVMDIHTAAFMGKLGIVQQHILAGTDLNKKDMYGSSPLIIAATFGKTEIAKALITGGADLNLKNNEGSTPLHIAAFFCRAEIVEVLLNNGADKTLKNGSGSTALQSVAGSFNEVKAIYDFFNKELGPLGLKLDYQHIKKTRPVVADMLR
ncbi:ankyrin repeat domain-containing protein [Bacteroidota bacterium]